MSKKSRTKGHSFERKISNEFKELGWIEARRHLEYQDAEAVKGIDLVNTYPFLVQTKKHKDYVSISSIKQVQEAVGQYPLLITQGDRKEPMAVMYWEDLKELIQMLKKENILKPKN